VISIFSVYEGKEAKADELDLKGGHKGRGNRSASLEVGWAPVTGAF